MWVTTKDAPRGDKADVRDTLGRTGEAGAHTRLGVLGVLDLCRDRCHIKTSKESKQGRHTRVNSTQRGQWGLKPEQSSESLVTQKERAPEKQVGSRAVGHR